MSSFLLAMICVAAAGCVRGTRPAPDLTYLDISPGTAPGLSDGSQDVLLLRRLEVQSPFDDRRFLYKTGSGTYESDYYVRFVASPADLLTAKLETWLNESRLFQAVVESGSAVEYRYILEGEIREFYGDYSNPGQTTAVIEAEFVLVDDLGGAGMIVLNKQYRHVEPITSPDASALGAGWGTALRRVFLDLVTDLQGSLVNIQP
jgi:ABC-type uncharacterized transport system auxiliary subunit